MHSFCKDEKEKTVEIRPTGLLCPVCRCPFRPKWWHPASAKWIFSDMVSCAPMAGCCESYNLSTAFFIILHSCICSSAWYHVQKWKKNYCENFVFCFRKWTQKHKSCKTREKTWSHKIQVYLSVFILFFDVRVFCGEQDVGFFQNFAISFSLFL